MTRLVVIGKKSYVGSRLSGFLAEQGVTDAVVVSSSECNFLDLSAVQRLFASLGRGGCTIVFLAAVNKWVDNSYRAFIDNSAMVQHLIAGAQLVNVDAVIYLSSADVYGNGPSLPITEQSPINPDTWYGLAKYVCEWMLLSTGDLSCPVTVLRIPGIYGRGHNDRSMVGKVASHILSERPVSLTNRGQALRDYVFIDDLCRLIYALIPLKYHGVLNVATGCSIPIIRIVHMLGSMLGVVPQVVFDAPDPSRDFDLEFDTAKLREALPRFTFTSIETAIRTYLELPDA